MASTPPSSDSLTLVLVTTLASPALETKNLEVGIGGHSIAKCQDISVAAGQVLVLIGKNGSGKSTFLRTLCGLLKPIDGEILFHAKPQREVSVEKTAAWLSQEEHLEFSWTVWEYVSLGRIAHNSGLQLTKQDEAVVNEALAQTDSESLSGRIIHELSGGERQRIRLARALAQDTPLILMDEPTTHLDLEHQIQFLQLIEKLAQQGKSIVVSLHDVFQAKHIGTQFLLFKSQFAKSVASTGALTKELLEETLGVRFEQFENSAHGGQMLPIYLRRTTD